MAVETFEGFDTFSISQVTRRYPFSVTTGASSMVTGRNSVGQALNLNADSQFVTAPVVSRAEYFGGFDFQVAAFSGGSTDLIQMYSAPSGSFIGSFGVATGGVITSTWGNSSSGAIFLNTWANLQFHIIISGTVGVVLVKIDGNIVINLTSQNTGTTNIGAFLFLGGNSQSHTYDNFWIMNTSGTHSNGFPTGSMIVQTSYPTSDGTYTDWAPKSGSTHYTQVNQTTADDDTTYNFDTSIGDKDTYNQGGVTGPISQVHAVMIGAVVKKDNIGAKKVRLLAKSGSTLQESPDIMVPASYTSETMLLLDDPNTSSEWLSTDVNSVEIGVKVTG